MITKDSPYPGNRPGDAPHGATTLRDREHGFASAVSMAYRAAVSDLPEDMRRLLARLG